MGLQDPDLTALPVVCVPQCELRPGFLRLTVAHVKDGDLIPLSHRHATVAGDGIVPTAAVPLAGVNLKLPNEAPGMNYLPSRVMTCGSVRE